MLNMKRTLLSVLFMAFATLCAWAQNPFSSVLSDYKVVATGSEQGRDRLDSTYYLHTQTYAVPYKGKKAEAKAAAVIKEIVDRYDKQLEFYTGGFCFSSELSASSPVESQQVSAYYGENLEPFVVGGMGRNYALLRQQDRLNPNYRTVYGVEWWLEKPKLLYFRTFRLFGPLTARNYQKAITSQGKSWEDFLSAFRSQGRGFYLPGDGSAEDTLKYADRVAWYLSKVCDLYKGDGSEMDNMLASVAVHRFLDYMREDNALKTDEGVVRVMRAFRLSGCYAEVNGKVVEHGDLPWLAARWKNLDISCTSHVEKGDPECQKYGEKSKYFLFRVYLK